MILIIGGSYQGKKDYAINKYQLKEEDICNLAMQPLDLNKKCLYNFHYLAYHFYDMNLDVKEEMKKLKNDLKNKIIIANDIFGGVVPMDKRNRIVREIAGLMMQELASEADSVIRIFFGLESVLK